MSSSSSRFDTLLCLYPEELRPYIMNIAERHSMYGTRTEAQIIYMETHISGELVECSPEGEVFSWSFRNRGYGMEVPAEYLIDMAHSGHLMARGEKQDDKRTGNEAPAEGSKEG